MAASERLWSIQAVTFGVKYDNDIPWHYSYQVPTFYVAAYDAAEATAKALDILPNEGMTDGAHIHHNLTVGVKE